MNRFAVHGAKKKAWSIFAPCEMDLHSAVFELTDAYLLLYRIWMLSIGCVCPGLQLGLLPQKMSNRDASVALLRAVAITPSPTLGTLRRSVTLFFMSWIVSWTPSEEHGEVR